MLASLYKYIYLVVVFLMTLFVLSHYNNMGNVITIRNSTRENKALFFLTLFFVFAIGLRPISYYFVDMMTYHDDYQRLVGQPFYFQKETDNYIFDNILPWFAANNISEQLYFLLIAFVYFGCMALACLKLFPSAPLLAFVVYLGAFSTFSYGTNGIKAGAAASVFLLALANRQNKKLAALFLWISLGFHHSMLAPIVAFVAALFYKNEKAYLYGWLFCLILAAAHITYFQTLFAGFIDEQGSSYLIVDKMDKLVSGFRPDFILYSAVPVFVGYYLISKKHIQSSTYSFLWCVYTLTNCVFLLCTYGSFINRIAYLSWLMYPIVLLYPFVNITWAKSQLKYVNYLVYGHLGFTLFMEFIYYA